MLKKFITISIFGVIAFFLNLIEIPYPFLPFLKYDCSELSSMLIGFKYGPVAGVGVILIRTILFYIFKGDGWWPVGAVAGLSSSIFFVVPAAYIYTRKKTVKVAIIALICGIIMSTLVMIPVNYFIGVHYFKMENSVIISNIIKGILPFNLLKGFINSILLYVIYKRVGKFL